MRNINFFLLSLTAILFLSCSNSKLSKTTLTITKEDGKTLTVKVEIAKTPQERNFGFMERKNIPEGTGFRSLIIC